MLDPADTKPSRELQILLADYAARIQESRGVNVIIAALFTVSTALLVGIGSLVIRRPCVSNETSASGQTGSGLANLIDTTGCLALPSTAYGLLPLAPFVAFAFATFETSQDVVRSYYIRTLETRIAEFASSELPQVRLRPPAFYRLRASAFSVRSGLLRYRLLILGALVAVATLQIAVTVRALLVVTDLRIQLVMGVFYLFLIGFFLSSVVFSYLRSQRLWEGTISAARGRALARNLGRTPPSTAKFVSYLVLPRRASVAKLLYLLIPAAAAFLATPQDLRPSILVTIGACAAFELIGYQARYIVNDIRDLPTDPDHVQADVRERFPSPSTARVRIALTTVVMRLMILLALCLFLPTRIGVAVAVAMGAVIVLTPVYEFLRGRAPAASPSDTWAAARWARVLLFYVGSAYAVRVSLAVWIGAAGHIDLPAMLGAAAYGGAAGCMLNLLLWTNEAACYRQEAEGDLLFTLGEGILEKTHLIILFSYIASCPPRWRRRGRLHGPDLARYMRPTMRASSRPGMLETHGAVISPWAWALVVTSCAGGYLGYRFGEGLDSRGDVRSAGAAMLTGAASAALAVLGRAAAVSRDSQRLSKVSKGTAALGLIGGTGALVGLAEAEDLEHPFLTALPVALCLVAFALGQAASYESLVRPVSKLMSRCGRLLVGFPTATLKWVVGERSLAFLNELDQRFGGPAGPPRKHRRDPSAGSADE